MQVLGKDYWTYIYMSLVRPTGGKVGKGDWGDCGERETGAGKGGLGRLPRGFLINSLLELPPCPLPRIKSITEQG